MTLFASAEIDMLFQYYTVISICMSDSMKCIISQSCVLHLPKNKWQI